MGKINKNVILVWLILLNLLFIPKAIKSQDKDSMIVTNNWNDDEVSNNWNDANIGFNLDLPRIKTRSVQSFIPLHYVNKIIYLTKKLNMRSDLVIAVAKAESSFKSFAISPKGAVGLMQLMKQTAKQYGVYNRFNYSENLEAGIKHLKYLYERYNFNIPLTLAAYNAGEASVEKYHGVPPYPETRQYIQRILGLMRDSSKIKVKSQFQKKSYKIKTKDGKLIILE